MIFAVCNTVHFLAMPPNSGKTTAAHKLVNEALASAKIAGALSISAKIGVPVQELAAVALGVPKAMLGHVLHHTSKRSGGKPVVIVVDDVDAMLQNDVAFRHSVINLATSSVKHKTFLVMMLFRDAQVAEMVRSWNGNQKLHMMPRDGTNPLELLPDPACIADAIAKQKLDLSEDQMNTFAELAQLARSVGFVADGAAVIRTSQHLNQAFPEAYLRNRVSVEVQNWELWKAATSGRGGR